MKKICLALLCLCFFAPTLLEALSDFRDWEWRRTIDPHGQTGLVRVPISPEIFGDSQLHLGDLRVIDDANRLVPHLFLWDRSDRGTQT